MDTCKICGAPRDPLNTNCKFCGTAYQISNVTGETYTNELSTILTRIDEGERSPKSVSAEITSFLTQKHAGTDAKVSAISTFAMPSDVESLLQFLAFCHGNAQMTVAFNDRVGDRVKGAWHGKAKMAFTQLKMKVIGNPSLVPYIAEYEPLYGVMAKKPMSGQAKALMFAIPALIVIMIFSFFMASIASKPEKAEKNRLDAVVQKVQKQIATGQYDDAEASCADIQWTYELQWDSSKEMVKAYDQKRNDLKTLISEARRNANKQ